MYLVIREDRPGKRAEGSQRIMVFEDHIKNFNQGYSQAIKRFNLDQKAYDVVTIRQKRPNAYRKWTLDEDNVLREKAKQGKTLVELSEYFQRGKGAITSRLSKLGIGSHLNSSKSRNK
jgi:hypothetical protein